MQTYRIRSEFREEYLEAIRRIAEAGSDLGCVFFEVYENDDCKNEFTEMMGFDSWNHYERLRRIPASAEVANLSSRLADWMEGGPDAMTVTHLTSVVD